MTLPAIWDIDAAWKLLLDSGAAPQCEIYFNAPGSRIARVTDPFGNVLGLTSKGSAPAKKTLEDQPSDSAMGVALWRAIAAVEAREEIRGPDSLADVFLTDDFRKLAANPAAREWLMRKVPGSHEFSLARTAWFDEVVREALQKDTPQIVFLGAGHDSRPYRFRHLIRTTRIFELDIGPTQRRKRQALEQANIPVPEQVTFVPINFTRDRLEAVLAAAGFDRTTGSDGRGKRRRKSYDQAMAHAYRVLALQAVLAAALTPVLVPGVQVVGQTEADPHRPVCSSAACRKIRSFLKAHYCGKSPFGNGPEDGCEIGAPAPRKADIDVIARYGCEWSEAERKEICQQYGQPPSEIRAALIRELRRLGLPAAEDRRTYFTVWKSRSSGWTLAEGYHDRLAGSDVTLCQVISMIGASSQIVVLRELPFQKTNADVSQITTWSLLDLTDVDGDGRPDAVLQGNDYEDHWIEVHSIQNGSHRMIFSGLGYYL